MDKMFKPPYLGCAYYPEDWDESEIDYDISMMKKAGINCARIGEFAWRKMEPKPGKFDFEWLHKVVNKLGENGIAVVLGTPTATPPVWLSKLYPDVFAEDANGRKKSHGGRRHCCSNNTHYVEYSLRITEMMAKEFKDDPYVVGWQIDNEIYGQGCFCPNCAGAFREYLHGKFGDIESLNARWNLNLFSQGYDDFSEIPLPRDAWHNPHLIMEWNIFTRNSSVNFVHKQADILHKYVSVPVGTDTMPVNGMNYRELNSKLDVVQFNHYNGRDNEYKCCLWFDYLRNFSKRPFWNTETHANWNGSTACGNNVLPEGFCRVNSILPIALGAEANMYWLWRTHWAGHELMHGAVLDTSGRPMHTFGEVRDTADILEKAADFINGTKVVTDTAMFYTSLNWNMLESQSVAGLNQDHINRFYKPLLNCGIRPDLVDAYAELDKYKLIFAPIMLTMEEGNLPERLKKWVEDGGILVAGPLSDIRTADGTKYKHKHFGFLEELTGAHWSYGIHDKQDFVKTEWTDSGESFRSDIYIDVFEPEGVKTLAKVTSGHSAINGKSVIVESKVGKGCVILVGTFLGEKDMEKMIRYVGEKADVTLGDIEGEVMLSPRSGEYGEGVFVIEYSGINKGKYSFDGTMVDILTDKTYKNEIELEPCQISVLVKK